MSTNTEKIVIQVQVKGAKELQNLEKNTNKATKATGGFTKGLIRAGAAIGSALIIFRQLNKVIGSAIQTFKGFEFQMAKVRAITGASDRDFQKLNNTAQNLGRTTFFTASQVAELQVNFGKLGFTTTEILKAQEATLLLATATQSDLGRAATVAGAAVRGFGLDASETARVVDVMAVAFTSSALDIEKFQTSMTKVAPIAAAAGISIESTTAIMGTLTDAGIEASIAGTSLRNIFLKMQDPTSDLSKHLGFTVESTEDLEKALTQLNDEGLSNAEMMELVDLRQVAAFQTMVNGADNVLDLADALEDATGEAQNMADIMGDTLEGDILRAKSAWQGFEIAIFTGNNNITRTLRGLVSNFADVVNAIVGDMRTTEQIADDFVSKSLKDVLKAQQEIEDLQKGGAPVETKTRVELLDDEIKKTRSVLNLRQILLEKLNEAAQGEGRQAVQAKEAAENIQIQIDARILQLNELKKIRDEEIEDEKQRQTKADLEADIKIEKDRRRRKKDRERQAQEDEKDRKKRLAALRAEKRQAEIELKQSLQAELNADKENLINGLITQEEFDNRAFEAEQAHLDMMRDLNIAYGDDINSINGQILDNELANLKRLEKEKEKQDKEDEEKRLERKQFALDTTRELNNALFEIDSQNRNRQQEQSLKMLEERKEAGVISQQRYEKEVDAINRDAFKVVWYMVNHTHKEERSLQ
jgi:TP901 family phage tail tape measure protein